MFVVDCFLAVAASSSSFLDNNGAVASVVEAVEEVDEVEAAAFAVTVLPFPGPIRFAPPRQRLYKFAS